MFGVIGSLSVVQHGKGDNRAQRCLREEISHVVGSLLPAAW